MSIRGTEREESAPKPADPSGEPGEPDFKALFRSLPSPYLILAPDTPHFTIIEVNEAYLRATNTARSAILGRGLFEGFPDNPNDSTATGERNLRTSLNAVLRTRAAHAMAVQKYDIPRAASAGGGFGERYWSPLNTPVLDAEGQVLHIVHYVEDVTEVARLARLRDKEGEAAQELRTRNEWLETEIIRSTQAEEQLDNALERERAVRADAETARLEAEGARVAAEKANKGKSAFLAKMSHELRTPLNAIAGYVDLLQMGIPGVITSEQGQYLGRIKRSEEHLLTLIDDLLNFAKIEAGHLSFSISDVRVFPALQRVEELIAPQLRAKGLDYKFTYCDDALTVHADGEKVRQILVNLLTNAIKYTNKGGTVTVWCDADGGTVEMFVRDTGHGIAAEHLESVFEPFVQVTGASDHIEGVGLGLAISRELARGMGGDLTVQSKLGEGSTFSLALPRATHEPAECAA